MEKRNLKLKLLVDKKNQKVLFAEAGSDVVDFLFGLLSLPVGTAARLLTAEGMVGSMGMLYDSLARMDDTYMQAGADKNTLLKPMIPSNASCLLSNFPLGKEPSSTSERRYYRCAGHGNHLQYQSSCGSVTDEKGVPCPGCKRPMTVQLTYVAHKPEAAEADTRGGYVKRVVTYMVMDNLAVEPMSFIFGITLLNKFGIAEVRSLEERTVELGMEEGLSLLKAALQSTSVLTDVFLGGIR